MAGFHYLLLCLPILTQATIRTFHWRCAATLVMDYSQAVKTGSDAYKPECLTTCHNLPTCGGALTSSYTTFDVDICIHLSGGQVNSIMTHAKPRSWMRITEISENTVKTENILQSNLKSNVLNPEGKVRLATVVLKLYVTESDKDFCKSMKKACQSVTNPNAACSLYVYSNTRHSAMMFLAFKEMVSLDHPRMSSPKHLVEDSRNCRIFWTEANTKEDRKKKPRLLKKGRINTTETETMVAGDFHGAFLDRVINKLFVLAMDVLTCQLFEFNPETGKKENLLPFTCSLDLHANTMGDPLEHKFYFVDKGFFSPSLNYIRYRGPQVGKFTHIKKLKTVPVFYMAINMRKVYFAYEKASRVSVFDIKDEKDETFVSCPTGTQSGPPLKGGVWGDQFYLLCNNANGDTFFQIYNWKGNLVDKVELALGPNELEISV